ncbi:MAG: hypothetical protein JWL86_5442 [Rhizobium sp.]|nr:hypothetical protein [Rhizobium sp.]
MTDFRPLTCSMPNQFASKMGSIARDAGATGRTDVGDDIDRGLILLRLLTEAGFVVTADFEKARY